MLRSTPTVHGWPSTHSRELGTIVTPPANVAASLNCQPTVPSGTNADRTPMSDVPNSDAR